MCDGRQPKNLSAKAPTGYDLFMERTVNKARGFRAAAEWDIAQQVRMTPRERMAAARQLKDRVYKRDAKDVRACHKTT